MFDRIMSVEVLYNSGVTEDCDARSGARPFPENAEEEQNYLNKLGHPDIVVREAAIREILNDGRDPVPFLLSIIDTSEWDRREQSAVETLMRLSDLRSVPMLTRLLSSRNQEKRLSAVKALRWHHVGPDPFKSCLSDNNWRVRIEAIYALSDFGRTSFLPLFAAALNDDHYKVRAAAANALGRLREPGAAKYLLRALDDESRRVKFMAIWAMQRIGCSSGVDDMIALLNDTDEEMAVSAIRAMGQLKARQSVEPLISLLAAGSHRVREEAACALGKIGDPRAVQPLVDTLLRGDAKLRHKAAWSLAAIGKPAAGPLNALLRHRDQDVRYFAVFSLGHMGLAQVAEGIYSRFKDESEAVRSEAASALARLKSIRR